MNNVFPKRGLKLTFKPFELQLKHTFTLATSSRNTTPVMLTKIEFEGHIGFGEASMPYYLGENTETATSFLSSLDLEQFTDPSKIEEILDYVDNKASGNNAAKASIDIALYDLFGKLAGQSWHKIWKLSPELTPETSFTIGIDKPEIIKQKVLEASPYKKLKVKLGSADDKTIIETIRAVSDVPLFVDVNQGWNDKKMALDMIFWLADKGVELIEQPMPKENIDDNAWLTEKSPLPIIADEAVLKLTDIKNAIGIYSGINIKLMKCTGMNEAYKMINYAHSNNLKVMLGCMTETSCAISAAAQLSPMADWADLDGNLLITNDPFKGIEIVNGKIILNDNPGIGINE